MQTKSIDTPLSEVTFRRYEKPYNLSKREAVRKLCLSLGLLSPGDSRDVIVDVFYILLEASGNQTMLNSDEIREAVLQLRKAEQLDELGTASSNLRRQTRRLREALLVEKVRNRYRVTEFATLQDIFNEKVEKFMLKSIMERIKDYLNTVDDMFRRGPNG